MISQTTIYAKALLAAWERAPSDEREKVIDKFIDILRQDRILPLTSNIISAVEQLVLDKEKSEAVIAEVAHQPMGHQRESLKKLRVTQIKETPLVIGGFKIRGENKIIDASIEGALKQVRQALILE
ncbi:hypothetical protein A3I40_00460 [Candidatus Uhrbacteria bacterium RIFCSPLOWO2_02_FULL_48_12]|uniref:Uncharacterized protein n=1 Tax=Candidatus Uhrbacteria bacterium RIFCSPLOWO2_02_FULL_48_12 TaxID=1802407 RepID=A0A1F7V6C9_9BACT|nr:MAG: hypothetical protein A3I40_00460 [Candidatus Uhrbacteria bacterium RIFCSPLOWO2_02_FULL_48_12]